MATPLTPQVNIGDKNDIYHPLAVKVSVADHMAELWLASAAHLSTTVAHTHTAQSQSRAAKHVGSGYALTRVQA
jgi:hypothetical protein